MKVICAGMPKTGTKSLAKALRILGYSVYDVEEHIMFHMDEWSQILLTNTGPTFSSMYQNIDAVTDLPPCLFYQEILADFPDAKIILTVRETEEVFRASLRKQFEALQNKAAFLLLRISPLGRKFTKILTAVTTAGFGSLDPDAGIIQRKRYREHNERVRRTVPPQQLLVYNVSQGWKPLCTFLDCEIPDVPFPKENVHGEKTNEFFNSSSFGRQLWREITVRLLLLLLLCLVSAFLMSSFIAL